MISNHYKLEADPSNSVFSFTSEGKNGKIKKVIILREIDGAPGYFNLGFGDLAEADGTLDDKSRSGNGDMEMVLSTVALAVIQFTDKNRNAIIYAEGSTPARNRLYRSMLDRYWHLTRDLFEVQGYHPDSGWEPFRSNRPYESFAAKRLDKVD